LNGVACDCGQQKSFLNECIECGHNSVREQEVQDLIQCAHIEGSNSRRSQGKVAFEVSQVAIDSLSIEESLFKGLGVEKKKKKRGEEDAIQFQRQ
jgi:hypothetical protein